jgi:hypothetical protein
MSTRDWGVLERAISSSQFGACLDYYWYVTTLNSQYYYSFILYQYYYS